MNNKIIINVQLHERRVAILENNKLVELLIERSDRKRLVGNIYKGIVENVISGLQASFVDIGLPQRAFLHISDISSFAPFADADTDEDEPLYQFPPPHSEPISKILQRGQEVVVQIYREPIGTKGPRATTQLSLAGRYLVLIPNLNYVGVSRRISNRTERNRLRQIARSIKPDGFAFIVRTIASGRSSEQLKKDLDDLLANWKKVSERAKNLPAPAILFRDAGLIPTLVRDKLSPEIDMLIIDSPEEHKKIIQYLESVAPEMVARVKLYEGSEPIFEKFDVERQIEAMLKRKIDLSSGGEIIIDQTEAMVTIDVNSKRFIGKSDPEQLVLKTNLEAVEEIVRQIRLRDLGGIIAIDFIDMAEPSNRQQVERALIAALKKDKAQSRILPMNEFGMVILTRQRVEQSIWTQVTERCPFCDGSGIIYSASTTVALIERWLIRSKGIYSGEIVVVVNPKVAEELLSDGEQRIKDFSREYNITLNVLADPLCSPAEFHLYDPKTGEPIRIWK